MCLGPGGLQGRSSQLLLRFTSIEASLKHLECLNAGLLQGKAGAISDLRGCRRPMSRITGAATLGAGALEGVTASTSRGKAEGKEQPQGVMSSGKKGEEADSLA